MAKVGSRYWNVSNFLVSYTNETTHDKVQVQLKPNFVAVTPLDFSYHCSNPPAIQSVNKTLPDNTGISVKFAELQVSLGLFFVAYQNPTGRGC